MKVERIFNVLLVLALLLSVGVQLSQVQAQGQAPMPQQNLPAAAALTDQIPIQGRLTDANGIPLNGTYTVTFFVYDAAVGGALLCGNIFTAVEVTNGLFNSSLDLCDLMDAFEGDQMYLGVQVGADPEMTPRQPIQGVPYAFNLKPGAVIKGANSYLFVPGSAFVNDGDNTTWGDMSYGSALIYRGATAGDKYIYIPITLPSVLYGQPVRVTSITVYYRCENGANNYIAQTALAKMTDANTSVALFVADETNRTSNTATSYTLATDDAQNTLSSGVGSLAVRFYLNFDNDTQYIRIGGVRLTLDHTP
jgi:hypothetical protein